MKSILRKDLVSLSLGLLFLSLAIGLGWYYASSAHSAAYLAPLVKRQLNSELLKQNKELTAVAHGLAGADSVHFGLALASTTYPYFAYQDGQPVLWSTSRVMPDADEVVGEEDFRFVTLQQGQYVAHSLRKTVDGVDYDLVSLLPVYYYSRIDNQYLRRGLNLDIFPNPYVSLSTDEEVGRPVYAYTGTYLFSMVFNPRLGGFSAPALESVTLVFFLLGLGSLLLWLHFTVSRVAREYNRGIALVLLVISLVFLRMLMFVTEFPFGLFHWDLFDPRFFAASALNSSLGDLLLNLLLLLWVVVFVYRWLRQGPLPAGLDHLPINVKMGLAGFLFVLACGLFHGFYSFIVLLYGNSQYTLDITQSLAFPVPKVVMLLCYMLAAVIYFFLVDLLLTFYGWLSVRRLVVDVVTMVASLLVYFAFAQSMGMEAYWVAVVALIYGMAVHALRFPETIDNTRYLTFLYFFSASLVCGMAGALAINEIRQATDTDAKRRMAQQLMLKNDLLAEFLLQNLAQNLQDDRFVVNRFYNPFLSKEPIIDKVREIYLTGYFDKYDVRISLYDRFGRPMDDFSQIRTIFRIKQLYNTEEYATDYEDLYLIYQLQPELQQRYLKIVELERQGRVVGYVLLDLSLKRIIPDSFYPELLTDNRFLDQQMEVDYDFAYFLNQELVLSNGGFNYKADFDPYWLRTKALYRKGVVANGYEHLGLSSSEGRTVVVSHRVEPAWVIAANFSFLFLSVLFVLLVGLLIYYLIYLLKGKEISFSAKIQLFLNASFFLPLALLSSAVLTQINTSYSADIRGESMSKAEGLVANIEPTLLAQKHNRLEPGQLATTLAQLARFAEVDLNLYSPSGQLVAASQPGIFNNYLLSRFLSPEAMLNIVERGDPQMIVEEAVGTMPFYNIYTAVRSSATGELLGVLSLPFFQAERATETRLIEVLVGLLNIFTVVFILFSLLSFFASRALTSPLRLLALRFQHTDLARENPSLEWRTHDEIGTLVDEYNKMLVKLENSREKLAQREKESAWREMAKQVAHEIKNPLTPMKLSLQHLQRQLSDISKLDGEKVEKNVHTLISQIDTLSDIATSFSSFAKMPIPKTQRFDLVAAVQQALQLFANERVKLTFSSEEKECFVVGDEKLMGRILSNLILNGMQATAPNQVPEIDVALRRTYDQTVLVSIADKGQGIPQEVQPKVFLPNFSTKVEGSGIGLAIAKRGIEHAAGSIWFETELGRGTTFFIEMPLDP